MRTIEIDEQVYRFIASQTVEIGEGANSILRRLLQVEEGETQRSANPVAIPGTPELTSELGEFLQSREFKRARNVTDRFVAILGRLHKDHPGQFDRVLGIEGRKRKYFSRSKQELSRSGSSVEPKPIPDSPFWVMTNASTPFKKRILDTVLDTLGYSNEAKREARQALES